MNCYICSRAGATRPAVGMCRHCGAGLCDQHFKEAQAFTVGGTTAYRCPHPIEAAGAAKPLPDL